ncbi:nucleoplasmin-2 isoform X2 [Colius striatus]|uniref:nucleoplasmin-2 isoform X2 n=1 Tax=Colius striatus TaxID=57412 RepID=UPI002B1E2DBC|nr:nucleoplasmin-2 isoform X2 [Colius striatus]
MWLRWLGKVAQGKARWHRTGQGDPWEGWWDTVICDRSVCAAWHMAGHVAHRGGPQKVRVACGTARQHTAGHDDLVNARLAHWQGMVTWSTAAPHRAGHGDLEHAKVAPRKASENKGGCHGWSQGRSLQSSAVCFSLRPRDPRDMSLTDSTDIGSKSEKPVSLIWGCELTCKQDSYTFQALEEWQCEQQLALRTICLGEAAQDEFHVVEIVPAEEGDGHAPVPLATLKPSVLPMATLVGVELTPPVTFRLKVGSGPVYISGQHVSMMPNLSWEEEEEDVEEEEPVEESPKGQVAKKGCAAKKRRLEKEDELNKVSPEEPLSSKGRGAARSRKAVAKK